jgi:two-component system NtrC family sensor kinase
MSNMDFLCETIKDIRKRIIDNQSFDVSDLKDDFLELSEVGEEIYDALNRIKEIVSAFRDYSDLDRMSGHYSFNVQSGIENTIQLQKSTLEDINVVTHVEEELYLDARGSELNQVFGHILKNAVLALENEEDKLIDINGYRNEGDIVLEFIDNGIGMEEDTLKHAFDPFYTTRDVGKGKGIGLSICYDIINNNYHGNIEISSEVSKGTKVTIIIPEEVRHARKNDE